ncbi:MAG: hypothetical protein JWQ89_200 [Devosia sp.]|uniref:helix-turn-helix transcriptional regulator n=1 Tax=Devosia sp. TaxID=1871048 RepID=UPI00260ACAC3|nr:helix-turn-helix transcriptional regulator [Devosia sp.]MDB5538473.1 hypothetical protein [Devosia sp.]
MPTVDPVTLAAVRKDRGLSQQALADRAGLGIATIKRIEGNKGLYQASDKVAEELAKALRVKEGALRSPYVKPNEYVRRELTVGADVDESIGYSIVEALYGIGAREQLTLAPLLTALVAEQSLQWRRERLEKLGNRVAELKASLASSGMTVASLSGLDAALNDERKSIEERDILGRKLPGSETRENPLTTFIAFVARSNGSDSVIRIEEGDGPNEIPDFVLGENQIEDLAGTDGPTLFAVAMGWVRLEDFPSEVRGQANDVARLAWVRAKLTDDQYSRATRWLPADETSYERL